VLAQVLMVAIGSSVLLWNATALPPAMLPLLAGAATGVAQVATFLLATNQFGFDRDGFRVYVLSGVPRRDILLGKNLALAPLFIIPAILILTALQLVDPMSVDLLVALVPQCISVYLLFCLPANLVSIFVPYPVEAGTARPRKGAVTATIRHSMSLYLLGLAVLPMLVPIGTIAFLYDNDYLSGVPACLAATLVIGAAVVLLYRFVLAWEGSLLQRHEQKILQVIGAKAE
jgi:ABC-2 type transport system permease protein